jgi:hypothetical protein
MVKIVVQKREKTYFVDNLTRAIDEELAAIATLEFASDVTMEEEPVAAGEAKRVGLDGPLVDEKCSRGAGT